MNKIIEYIKANKAVSLIGLVVIMVIAIIAGSTLGSGKNGSPSGGSILATDSVKLSDCSDYVSNAKKKLSTTQMTGEKGEENEYTAKLKGAKYDVKKQRIVLTIDVTNKNADKGLELPNGQTVSVESAGGVGAMPFVKDLGAGEDTDKDLGSWIDNKDSDVTLDKFITNRSDYVDIPAGTTTTYYYQIPATYYTKFDTDANDFKVDDKLHIFIGSDSDLNEEGEAICTTVTVPNAIKKDIQQNGLVTGLNFEHIKLSDVTEGSGEVSFKATCENKTGKSISACSDLIYNGRAVNGMESFIDSADTVESGNSGTAAVRYEESNPTVKIGDSFDRSTNYATNIFQQTFGSSDSSSSSVYDLY